jgi:hypothetical protein
MDFLFTEVPVSNMESDGRVYMCQASVVALWVIHGDGAFQYLLKVSRNFKKFNRNKLMCT